eukprot:358836-Chlamydomonas_euryale.AAC.2
MSVPRSVHCTRPLHDPWLEHCTRAHACICACAQRSPRSAACCWSRCCCCCRRCLRAFAPQPRRRARALPPLGRLLLLPPPRVRPPVPRCRRAALAPAPPTCTRVGSIAYIQLIRNNQKGAGPARYACVLQQAHTDSWGNSYCVDGAGHTAAPPHPK